ncbi:MAG: 4Fe-4S dicluster domain-containing protein [Dehalococcoidia bacterium]|nr:4Fe-4S dicluster domain-containing protein [Dehalococcoidia bacterium]
MVTRRVQHKWVMVVDLDRCTGCQACVIACQAENNIPINTEERFLHRRANEWIRIERYWEGIEEAEKTGDPSKVKARFIPIMCQHCENAPCEPVCPVYASYHNNEGLNVQVYNRCIGVRLCGNNCPYHARFFNFWQPTWPESLNNQLNPHVTVRTRGIMEKCTFCVQRLRKAGRKEVQSEQRLEDKEFDSQAGMFAPACARACPTNTLTFGDINDPSSRVAQLAKDERHYQLLASIGTDPNVIYLKKVDKDAGATATPTHE